MAITTRPKKQDDKPWILINLRLIIAVGVPLLTGLIVAGYNLPIVLTRVDDGNRSARLIEGNGIVLIWAPSGPGWNWKQDFGGYPSWDSLAAYGIEPHGLDSSKLNAEHATEKDMLNNGLCAFLDESGKHLMPEAQYIWRMPTVDEMARSLSLHNQNAGCAWDGDVGRLNCEIYPDKETPLWAPDQPPVYYWAANAFNEVDAYYLSYSAYISHQPKNWGNPRHGYRCVKEH